MAVSRDLLSPRSTFKNVSHQVGTSSRCFRASSIPAGAKDALDVVGKDDLGALKHFRP